MKRKLLAVVLSVSMMAAMLTGCGKAKETEKEVETSSVVESKEEVVTPVAQGEAIPEAVYHFTFDGEDEGFKTVIQTEDKGANTGAALGVIESDTYVDKEGAEQKIQLQYADGPVGKAAYLDGNYGLKLPVAPLETETYTISFWINADRLSNFGATVQLGSDIGMSDADAAVKWINFTQTEWGTSSAKIFPVVWNRNAGTGAWPWVYAADDSIHGKKEWVLVTLVATGSIYNYADDGCDRNACQLYLNGELAYDAVEGSYGGLATGIMDASDNFECFVGINYWDTIFKGFIDDLYFFDQALTPGQVLTLFQMGDPTVESVATAAVADDAEPVAQVVTNIDANAIATVGVPTCDNGFWASFSDAYEVKDGKSVKLHFNNYSSGLNNWSNYVLAFTNTATTADKAPSADNYAGYAEYGVVRADAFGWAFPEDPAYEYSWTWEEFVNIMMDADVTLTISRKAGDVTVDGVIVDAAGAEYTYKISAKTTAAAADPMYVFITGEGSYIELLSVE